MTNKLTSSCAMLVVWINLINSAQMLERGAIAQWYKNVVSVYMHAADEPN